MGDKRFAIGIGLNLFDARALLMSEDGKVLARVDKKRNDINANETIQVILELFEAILERSKKYRKNICGVGIALGGIIERSKGIIYWPQRVDSTYVYISVPLKKYLEERFKLPVLIENDANACLWAEYNTNFKKYRNILYMFSGVGCGILVDGSIYKGRNGAAGELFVTQHDIMASPLGDFSFLKQWPADLGVTKRVKELIALGKNTSLIKWISPAGLISLENIIKEANNKDKLAREVLREAAFSLGIKLSFLINFLNPGIVIIGGGFEEADQFFLDEVQRAVKEYSFNEMRCNLKVVFSKLGRDAITQGAGSLVFKEIALHAK